MFELIQLVYIVIMSAFDCQISAYTTMEEKLKVTLTDLNKRERQLAANEQEVSSVSGLYSLLFLMTLEVRRPLHDPFYLHHTPGSRKKKKKEMRKIFTEGDNFLLLSEPQEVYLNFINHQHPCPISIKAPYRAVNIL